MKVANWVALILGIFGLLVLGLTFVASSVSSFILRYLPSLPSDNPLTKGYNIDYVIGASSLVLAVLIASLANRGSSENPY